MDFLAIKFQVKLILTTIFFHFLSYRDFYNKKLKFPGKNDKKWKNVIRNNKIVN